MTVLLVQSCSKSKRETTESLPAAEIYTGYFYKIIDKAEREGVLRDDVALRILSAKHGLIHPETEIAPYDERMDQRRAGQLNSEVVEEISSAAAALSARSIVINGGKAYRRAVAGIEDAVPDDVTVRYLQGAGIGEMGTQLKSLIRSDHSTPVSA